jgi:chorismate mutase
MKFGIQRVHVQERIARYRAQNPDDTREDWIIAEAIALMMKPRNQPLEMWIFRQVFEDQLDGESVLTIKHKQQDQITGRELF